MNHNLLITGIPRSGTSYLCSALNNVRNTVIINEPHEVLQVLHNSSNVPLQHFYDAVRERINNGLPIANKIVNGKFIEDTNENDVRTNYIAEVDSTDFLLGTKNTLVYLNNLDRLAKELPDGTVVACVRHPHDTIASWSKVSFPHIKNADPRFLLEYVSEQKLPELNEIIQLQELTQRYAIWWDYLAKICLEHREQIILVQYEKLVTNPEETLSRIYQSASFPKLLKQPLSPSQPRHHENALDQEITQLIKKHCNQSAQLLGYKL